MKKLISVIFIIIIFIVSLVLSAFALSGDIDGDGKTDPSDARSVLRLSLGLEEMTEEKRLAADATHDGKVESDDARLVLRTAVGLDEITHRFPDEFTVTVEPGCTEPGVKEKKCPFCGETVTESVPAAGHRMEFAETVEATCTEDGYTEYVCIGCGISEKTVIEATGHSMEYSKTAEPTCTEEGFTEYICKSCGLSEKTPTAALGHSYEFIADPEAGTYVSGLIKEVCKVCGDVKSTEYVPSLIEKELVTADSLPVETRCIVDGYPWVYSEEFSTDGVAFVSSNKGKNSTVSTIAFTVEGAGMFSFERFSSCENCDGLTVSTAAPATEASGEMIYSDEGFTPVFININAAEGEKTTVYLSFVKDYFAGQKNDCAAVRNVCFLPFTSDVSVKSSDEIYGSVSIEGAEENEVTLDTGAEITVKAVPSENGQFFAWCDKNGKAVSDNAVYTFNAKGNTELTAVFAEKNSVTAVNGGKLYDDLADALDDAVTGDRVVLLKDHTLSRSAAVKPGVKLLLPCADGDKGYADTGYNPDGTTGSMNAVLETLYITLTVPENVTLDVDGFVLVNAVTGRCVSSGSTVHNITGGYALIKLDGMLNINGGGVMDCAGRVEGSGKARVFAGGTLYETYAIERWRGGTYALKNIEHFYPVTESAMNSIRTSLRIDEGASLIGTVKLYASGAYNYCRFPQIDGENGLYRLHKGAYCIRTVEWDDALSTKYNYTTTVGGLRDVYKFYGGMDFSSSTLAIVMNIPLSTDFMTWFVVDGDMSFELYDGEYNVTKCFKFLPGFIMKLGKDAVLNVENGGGLLFCDEKYTELDSQFQDQLASYPLYRKAACLYMCSGSHANVKAGSALAGKVFTEKDSMLSFSKSAESAVTTLVAVDYVGKCTEYTVVIDSTEV